MPETDQRDLQKDNHQQAQQATAFRQDSRTVNQQGNEHSLPQDSRTGSQQGNDSLPQDSRTGSQQGNGHSLPQDRTGSQQETSTAFHKRAE
jgi:hypothetical protein